jgi:hypothetical protein
MLASTVKYGRVMPVLHFRRAAPNGGSCQRRRRHGSPQVACTLLFPQLYGLRELG